MPITLRHRILDAGPAGSRPPFATPTARRTSRLTPAGRLARHSMQTTMKALVKKKAEPGLWLEDVPVPAIGINDVLIQVLRTGICGTDLHIYNWDAWAQRTIPVPLV